MEVTLIHFFLKDILFNNFINKEKWKITDPQKVTVLMLGIFQLW